MIIPSRLQSIITVWLLLCLPVHAHALRSDQVGQEERRSGNDQVEWLQHATALAASKNWPGLVDWCQKWTKSEPRSAAARLELGMAYSKLKRHNDAIGAYRQAVKINPNYFYAWNNLGNAYNELNRTGDAVDAYRQALSIDPNRAYVWFNLGIAYLKSGNQAAALEVVRSLQRLNPEQANVLFSMIGPH